MRQRVRWNVQRVLWSGYRSTSARRAGARRSGLRGRAGRAGSSAFWGATAPGPLSCESACDRGRRARSRATG
eukprot:2543631-Prymnesium_polylepis.1